MLIKGILADFQIIFLPGFLLLQLFRFKKPGLLQTIIFSFGLSLLANYIGVLLLTTFRIYMAPVVFIIFVVECFILIKVSWPVLNMPLQKLSSILLTDLKAALESWSGFLDGENNPRQSLFTFIYLVLMAVFMILTVDALLWLFQVFQTNIGEVFQSWDAIYSWNNWATQLADNKLPLLTELYPQLIPANWSLTYVFIQTTKVQFFAKAIMPLFTIFTLLLLVDLGLEFKAIGYFIAAVIARYMIKKFLGEWIADGYVDIPLMFFGFLAIFPLIKATNHPDLLVKKRYILIGALFSAGAAVTKQGGIYLVLIYPFLAYFLVFHDIKENRPRFSWWAGIFLIMIVILVPWYLYKEIDFARGIDNDGINYVTNAIYHGLSLPMRMVRAIQLLEKYQAVFVIAILSFPLLNKTYRFLLATIVLPYSILWGFYVSYEIRNISLVIPFVCLIAGIGIDEIVQRSGRLSARIRLDWLRPYPLVFLLCGGLLFLGSKISSTRLLDRQFSQQLRLVYPKLNERIYDLVKQQKPGTKILSNYTIDWLPELENTRVYNDFRDFRQFKVLLSKDPDFRYILYPDYADPLIQQKIEADITAGKDRLVFQEGGWKMIEILSSQ